MYISSPISSVHTSARINHPQQLFSLLGRGLLRLPDALLLALLLGNGVASLRQGFRALDWLTEQHTVVHDLLLQLLELGADDAVALRAGQTQLEPIEVGQVASLLGREGKDEELVDDLQRCTD